MRLRRQELLGSYIQRSFGWILCVLEAKINNFTMYVRRKWSSVLWFNLQRLFLSCLQWCIIKMFSSFSFLGKKFAQGRTISLYFYLRRLEIAFCDEKQNKNIPNYELKLFMYFFCRCKEKNITLTFYDHPQ